MTFWGIIDYKKSIGRRYKHRSSSKMSVDYWVISNFEYHLQIWTFKEGLDIYFQINRRVEYICCCDGNGGGGGGGGGGGAAKLIRWKFPSNGRLKSFRLLWNRWGPRGCPIIAMWFTLVSIVICLPKPMLLAVSSIKSSKIQTKIEVLDKAS